MQAEALETRTRAWKILRKVTERSLAYDPAADRSAREEALAGWRAWWNGTGKLRPRDAKQRLVVTGDLLTAAKDFKWKGLDIALLLDSTGSMAGLIRGAKESIDEIVTELATLLPSLRVSVYTYRDHGDDYLFYGTPLTYDTGNLAGFLQNAVHGQGGDIPEAVFEVVTNAMDKLAWRPNAHKVIVFAGDAPYHPEQQTDFLRAIRTFCTPKNQAELHAIFTDTNRRSLDVRARRERPNLSKTTSPFFEKYELAAKTGRGKAILLDDESTLLKELLVLAFGEPWREDIETVLEFER
jgi:hypothetical protein